MQSKTELQLGDNETSQLRLNKCTEIVDTG